MKRLMMSKLVEWKSSNNKKPLLLFGAINTGKTYLIKDFGSTYFNDMIYINCESNIFSGNIFDDQISFNDIIKKIELIFNKKIDKENTLIFFDEIEKNQNALHSLLNYSNGNMEYYVTASISSDEKSVLNSYDLANNRIESLTLYPLSFEEFMINTDNEDILIKIKACFKNKEPLPGLIHKKAFDLYYNYLIVGGMPNVVNEYINSSSAISSIDYQKDVINKYENILLSNLLSKRSVSVFKSIPSQLLKDNKKFQYKLVYSGGTSNSMIDYIDYIVNSKMAYKCLKIDIDEDNNIIKDKDSFVLYLNDVGLLTNMSEFPIYFIKNREAVNEKMFDMLSKNYIACTLAGNGFDLYYWKNNFDSKLDFILSLKNASFIPVEIKSDNHIKSRSLNNFINTYKPKFGIRFSTKNFSFKNNIITIPLYAAFCLKEENL